MMGNFFFTDQTCGAIVGGVVGVVGTSLIVIVGILVYRRYKMVSRLKQLVHTYIHTYIHTYFLYKLMQWLLSSLCMGLSVWFLPLKLPIGNR